MMKVALVGLLVLAGLGGSAAARQQPRLMDPNEILFSISTLSDDAAPTAPLKGKASATDVTFHEDDWRQIEFFPASRQRAPGGGWKKVYVRELPARPVVAGAAALGTLAKDLGVAVQPGPVINQGPDRVIGRVAHGFSLAVGRGVALYGFSDASGVPVLGAHVEEGAEEDALTKAFVKLNAKHQLILVDWRAHLLVSGMARNGSLVTWRPDRGQ